MPGEWQMPRRSDACAACGRDFVEGQHLYAYLYERGGTYERRDFCQVCQPREPTEAIGCWTTRRVSRPISLPHSFDREAILSLFEGLDGAAEPARLQLRFVLGLLLWRKKVLKLERTEAVDRGERWWFAEPRSSRAHSVQRPELNEAQIEQLSVQLEQILSEAIAPTGDHQPVLCPEDIGG